MLSDAPPPSTPRRLHGDEGTVMMLMPAAVLVVLILGAIAVDLSVVHLAKRDLLDLAASAANDAATDGLPPEVVRGTGDARIEQNRAEAAVHRSVTAHRAPNVTVDAVIIGGLAQDQVTVRLSVHVDYIFAKSIPGANQGNDLHATATATAEVR